MEKVAKIAEKRAANALSGRSIAFIGGGAMAGAMIGGLLNSHAVESKAITASDPHADRIQDLEKRFGVATTGDNLKAARNAEIVILSVKPQMLRFVFRDLCGKLGKDALVLSIIAGARIESMTQGLKHGAIVRSMPNTPAQVAEGMTVWTSNAAVTAAQREQAQTILKAFGKELYVADEAFLDMATAISGSGPSYVFLFMEALIDAAVHLGFSREDARTLVTQTVRGSAIYAEHSPSHPAEMRNLVTSPGGTSAHALYQLEKGGFRTLLSKAVWAAFQRSVSLSALNSAVQPFEEKDDDGGLRAEGLRLLPFAICHCHDSYYRSVITTGYDSSRSSREGLMGGLRISLNSSIACLRMCSSASARSSVTRNSFRSFALTVPALTMSSSSAR